MNTFEGMDPVPVHLASIGDNVGIGPPSSPRPRRRRMRPNTYTLTATNPTQRVFPPSDNRVEGWITAAVAASSPPIVFISTSQAGAAAQAGGAAQINGTDTTPFPVNTTDEVWISAASGFPVTVSVIAIYDEAV